MLEKIKSIFEPLFTDKPIRRIIFFSIFLNLLSFVLVLLRAYPFIIGGKITALHYNVYLKVNDVGSPWWLFFPCAIGLVVLAINVYLAARVSRNNRQHALILCATTAFYELVLLAAVLFMAYINLFR
jgi:hypothetical protein